MNSTEGLQESPQPPLSMCHPRLWRTVHLLLRSYGPRHSSSVPCFSRPSLQTVDAIRSPFSFVPFALYLFARHVASSSPRITSTPRPSHWLYHFISSQLLHQPHCRYPPTDSSPPQLTFHPSTFLSTHSFRLSSNNKLTRCVLQTFDSRTPTCAS